MRLALISLLMIPLIVGCSRGKGEDESQPTCTAGFTLIMPDGTSTTLDFCAAYSMDATFEFDPNALEFFPSRPPGRLEETQANEADDEGQANMLTQLKAIRADIENIRCAMAEIHAALPTAAMGELAPSAAMTTLVEPLEEISHSCFRPTGPNATAQEATESNSVFIADTAAAAEATGRQPEAANDIRTTALIMSALIEGVALFCAVTCFLLQGALASM